MVALITGSNRGLGLELVKEGLKRGHTVIATYRSPGEELKRLKNTYGGRLHMEVMDVADHASVKSAAERIRGSFGALDTVINNAAVLYETKYFTGDPIVDVDLEKFYMTFEVNTFGPVRVLKEFMPLVYKGGDRCIVNISTEGAKLNTGKSHYIAYSSSKIAMNLYTQKIRNYLNEREDTGDIRVFMVHPGRMFTEMGAENAQIEASVPAAGIWDIIERRKEVRLDIPFINYKGEPMPL